MAADDLRQRMEAAMRRDDFSVPTMADAAWSEVLPELERLRADDEIAQQQIGDLNTRIVRAEKRAGNAEGEVERLRAELANRDTLLDKHRETLSVVLGQREEAKAERDAAVAAVRTAQTAHIRETHPDYAHVGACAGCQVLVALSLAMPARPDDPEEIRRLAQATTESTEETSE